ncbi:toll/interleukin-1 receptor domain-containing protein [Rhodococcus sp. ACT016]|uniref:toll/interleukin-1 receptor domain-containing protein n=1 Tax=Rhodococcus sp. ACT016 TaxID=3134808 RepID=UPI003D2799F8
MGADLFISYAWTSDEHRQWVRLLASQLKALGIDVLIDADLDYGDDLTGFMRRVVDSKHVLLVVDENYVHRADTLPDSGVGKENSWIAEVKADRPATWLAVLFKDNPDYQLPDWLADASPKGFPFNHDPSRPADFPGSEQVEDLWRWIEGLPTNRDHATPIATLRERSSRLEQHSLRSDPSQWRSPSLSGEVRFAYADAPHKNFHWGYGVSEFSFHVSGHGSDSVYVYKDPIEAVGIVRSTDYEDADLAGHLSPGRSVVAHVGHTVVLMNKHGRLALVEMLDVQSEVTNGSYVAPHVTFRWRVVESS